jgi:hypothetical protein
VGVASTPVRYQSPDEDSARWRGILKSNAAFFRRGTSGAGREILSRQELAAYHTRAARLAPAGMLTWLYSPRASPIPAGPGEEDGPAEGDHDRPLP